MESFFGKFAETTSDFFFLGSCNFQNFLNFCVLKFSMWANLRFRKFLLAPYKEKKLPNKKICHIKLHFIIFKNNVILSELKKDESLTQWQWNDSNHHFNHGRFASRRQSYAYILVVLTWCILNWFLRIADSVIVYELRFKRAIYKLKQEYHKIHNTSFLI